MSKKNKQNMFKETEVEIKADGETKTVTWRAMAADQERQLVAQQGRDLYRQISLWTPFLSTYLTDVVNRVGGIKEDLRQTDGVTPAENSAALISGRVDAMVTALTTFIGSVVEFEDAPSMDAFDTKDGGIGFLIITPNNNFIDGEDKEAFTAMAETLKGTGDSRMDYFKKVFPAVGATRASYANNLQGLTTYLMELHKNLHTLITVNNRFSKLYAEHVELYLQALLGNVITGAPTTAAEFIAPFVKLVNDLEAIEGPADEWVGSNNITNVNAIDAELLLDLLGAIEDQADLAAAAVGEVTTPPAETFEAPTAVDGAVTATADGGTFTLTVTAADGSAGTVQTVTASSVTVDAGSVSPNTLTIGANSITVTGLTAAATATVSWSVTTQGGTASGTTPVTALFRKAEVNNVKVNQTADGAEIELDIDTFDAKVIKSNVKTSVGKISTKHLKQGNNVIKVSKLHAGETAVIDYELETAAGIVPGTLMVTALEAEKNTEE